MAYKELKTKHLQNYRSAKNYPVFLTNNTMKKLSETLTELGIDCAFPIEIMEANDRVTYFEDCDDYWERYERDAKGRPTYHEDSNGFWQKWKRNADGDVLYYEDSTGVKKGIPESLTKPLPKPEEKCAFCDKPDVFRKGLCPICFEEHYGDR